MVISQGDVCWASLDDPVGSSPESRRPVTVVQGDSFNASRIATTVVVPLTSNLRLSAAPGNVVLSAERTGLPKDSS
jgi:mRNA interferase MazF